MPKSVVSLKLPPPSRLRLPVPVRMTLKVDVPLAAEGGSVKVRLPSRANCDSGCRMSALTAGKNGKDFNVKRGTMVRSEGPEPPRCYSLPPQGSASTNSATSAKTTGRGLAPGRIDGADVTNRGWGDKGRRRPCRLSGAGGPGQHLLDFDRDPVAVDQHHAAGNGQVVGQHLDLVLLGGVQFDDGAAAEPHYLMNGHRGGAEHHHEVDRYFIQGWHF